MVPQVLVLILTKHLPKLVSLQIRSPGKYSNSQRSITEKFNARYVLWSVGFTLSIFKGYVPAPTGVPWFFRNFFSKNEPDFCVTDGSGRTQTLLSYFDDLVIECVRNAVNQAFYRTFCFVGSKADFRHPYLQSKTIRGFYEAIKKSQLRSRFPRVHLITVL